MYINKFKLRENVFIIFIFVIILEYQLSLVHTFLFDRIIKIVSFIILIIFFKNIRDNKKNIYIQRITKIYLALFLIFIASTIANLSVISIIFLIKYSLVLVIVFLLLYKVHPNYFSDKIIKFPIFIGAVLSLSSITLWLLVYFGIEPQAFDVSSERFTRIAKFSYLWGDMCYTLGGGISRACSFFTTPNRYGNFLIFPAFVSYGYFVLKKQFRYLFVCILCSVVIFLTFSLTILLASILAISLNLFFGMVCKIKEVKKVSFTTGIVGLLLSLILILGVFKAYQFKYSQNPTNKVFRGGTYQTLFHSFVCMENVFVPDINKPFGSGLATMKDGQLYTPQFGFVQVLILLGYPGIIFFLVFIAYMFKVHVFPALMHKPHRIERYVALAFVAQTMCGIEEGAWLYTHYLFTTAIFVLLKKYEFKEWRVR